MKKTILLILFCLIVIFSKAQFISEGPIANIDKITRIWGAGNDIIYFQNFVDGTLPKLEYYWKDSSGTVSKINKFSDIDFLKNSITGFKVIDNSQRAEIYKTIDGGYNWHLFNSIEYDSLGSNISYFVNALYLNNENEVYITGTKSKDKEYYSKRLWKVTKTGYSFEEYVYSQWVSVYFVNDNIGFKRVDYQNETIETKTQDGGKTWSVFEYKIPGDSNEKVAIPHFITENYGFTRSHERIDKKIKNGRIYRTFDGGQSWDLVYYLPENACVFENYLDTNTVFFIISHLNPDNNQLLYTLDQGENWIDTSILFNFFNCPTSSRCYLHRSPDTNVYFRYDKTSSGIDSEKNKNSNIKIINYPGSESIIIIAKNLSNEKTIITIYSVQGKQIHTKQVYPHNGQMNEEINISRLSKGIYLLHINNKEVRQTSKIVSF